MQITLHPTLLTVKVKQPKNRLAKWTTLIVFMLLTSLLSSPLFSQNTPVSKTNISANTTVPKSNDIELNAETKKTIAETLKASSKDIWFEKNEGQFGNPEVLYGFRTAFGSMGVYKNKLRLVATQSTKRKKVGHQIVDISFPGSLQNWAVIPGSRSDVKGSYNTKSGAINATIYNEITLKNVYPGINLRLYSGGNGQLEFDWLLAKASDRDKIRMNFKGQNKIKIDKNGEIVIGLKYDDMKMVIPETYQLIKGRKELFSTKMITAGDNNTLKYEIAGNLNPDVPLVIDPVMIWSTYVHNNSTTFDEYLYTIAVNTASEVYACGVTNEAISTAYMSGVAPGFLSTYTFNLNSKGDEQSVILYRLNPSGTVITAWTYTGMTTNIPVAMGIFPDNRILVVYQTDTIQIFSADLTTRLYNDIISADVGANVMAYQSQAIIDNDVFYVGGIAVSPLSTAIIPATAPDPSLAGVEGVILRIKNATTTPVPEWGTYVGGNANESFTAIAATPDKTKLAFAVHVDGNGGGYPALVNAVDNTISGTELLVGVIPTTSTPTAFSVFSYLGGSGDEGKASKDQNAALVAADNSFFYVAGNTTSTDVPNTVGNAQAYSSAATGKINQFISQIPLNGSAGGVLQSTYNGGSDLDIVGGLVIDLRTNDVLLFGTSQSINFPVYNTSAYSPFYQPIHGNTSSGPLDITYSVFANGLATRKFSTYIGGSYNDYLGSTGKLQGTGHFQYNPTNGFTYIGTTIHSDQTTIPPQWMSSIPGFDKSIPPANVNKDNHFIFAMSPSTDDFGDAPASYDAGTPASSAVSFFNLRIGDEVDAEEMQQSSAAANGDDTLNSGSLDDEDGIAVIPPIATGDTDYTVTVSVFNNTGATVNLCGWIDTDGNGLFDAYEYATISVPSNASQQSVVLNFTGLPPFTTTTGISFLRLRIANVTITADDATGALGFGEVEDHVVLPGLTLSTLLEKFTAAPQAQNVLLNWTVGKETNVNKYQLEHSTNNLLFSNLNTIPATGNRSYNWIHTTPEIGTNYYRIKIIGTAGNIKYSNIQKVNFGLNSTATIYPNPAKDVININLTGGILNKPATISIYSFDGKALNQKKINSLSQRETFDVSPLTDGQYILKIHTDSEEIVRKINIINHK